MQACDVAKVPEGSIPSHIEVLCWVSFVSCAELLNMIGLVPSSALCSMNLSWHGYRCGCEPAHRRSIKGPDCAGQERPWYPRLDDKGGSHGIGSTDTVLSCAIDEAQHAERKQIPAALQHSLLGIALQGGCSH